MANTNEVRITGNLGKDVEFRAEVGNGLASFSLAHNRYRPTDEGYAKMPTSWFRCVAWGKLAEKVRGLKKGDRVAIVGRLESRSWKDTRGVEHSGVEIVIESIEMASSILKSESELPIPAASTESSAPDQAAGGKKKSASSRKGGGNPANRPEIDNIPLVTPAAARPRRKAITIPTRKEQQVA